MNLIQVRLLRPAVFLIALACPASAALDLSTGLLGFWRFEGNTNDSSTNNLGLSNVNAATFGPGTNGQCFVPGTNGAVGRYGVIASMPSITNLTNQLTFSMWVKYPGTNGTTGNRTALISRMTPVTVFDLDITEPPGLLRLLLYTNGGNAASGTSSTALATNQWIHIAVVYNGVTFVVYTNGLTNFSGASTANLNSHPTELVHVGTRGDGPSTYVLGSNGGIDELSIWNRALTREEVQVLLPGIKGAITNVTNNQNLFAGMVLRGNHAAVGGVTNTVLIISNASGEVFNQAVATNAVGEWSLAVPALPSAAAYSAYLVCSNLYGQGAVSATSFNYYSSSNVTVTLRSVSSTGTPWYGGKMTGPFSLTLYDGVRTNDSNGMASWSGLFSGRSIAFTNFSPRLWGRDFVVTNLVTPDSSAVIPWVIDAAPVGSTESPATNVTLSNQAPIFVSGRASMLRLPVAFTNRAPPRATVIAVPLAGGRKVTLYDKVLPAGGSAWIEIPGSALDLALAPGNWLLTTQLVAVGQDSSKAVVSRRLLFYVR